jgi:hypothetical protein
MLRISTYTSDDELVMKLEGCLAGPWVRELETCWREASSRLGLGSTRVDLTGVCHVDAPGQQLMTQMYHAGARFVARGCVMPEIVREISEAAEARHSASQRR